MRNLILSCLVVAACAAEEATPRGNMATTYFCDGSTLDGKYIWNAGTCWGYYIARECQKLTRQFSCDDVGDVILPRNRQYDADDKCRAYQCALQYEESLYVMYGHNGVDINHLLRLSEEPWPGEEYCREGWNKQWYKECFTVVEP